MHTLLDSDLYLSRSTWDANPARAAAAGVPEEVTDRPVWRLALRPIDRVRAHGIVAGCLTFGDTYAKQKDPWKSLTSVGSGPSRRCPRLAPPGRQARGAA